METLRKERPRGEALVPRSQLRLHRQEPDYTRPLFRLEASHKSRMLDLLGVLYGPERAAACIPELERILQVYYAYKTPEMIEDDQRFDPANRFTERDIIGITYGDLFSHPARRPLRVLTDIAAMLLKGTVNTLHILPFFPYSSDRGFSVVDYREVDPRLGSWDDIEELSLNFRLMFDGVFNHVSAQGEWFREFLDGNPEYQDFFISFSTRHAISEDHLRLILRPRTSDLLTAFQTLRGERYVWTTFSPDQVDLNYASERVLLRVIQVLLYYVRRGADVIRLDAATYMWHELGTSCAHLEQTHALVRLFRAVLDAVAPQVALMTETNVPHADNVAYFGDGSNEAHMIYNFTLPVLTLRTMRTGNCRRLSEWASTLSKVSDYATYFNFLDSHDGVGLLGARGILDEDEIADMVRRTLNNGGVVSYRTNRDGSRSPYELNITWWDALNRRDSGEALDLQVDRFVASRSIALALMGVPGIYLPSIGGSQFDFPGLSPGEDARSINRRTIPEDVLLSKLRDPDSAACRVAMRFLRLLDTRIGLPAFHPNGRQKVLMNNNNVFSVIRESPDRKQLVLALTNVTASPQTYDLCRGEIGFACPLWRDAVADEMIPVDPSRCSIQMAPYQVRWLLPAGLAC